MSINVNKSRQITEDVKARFNERVKLPDKNGCMIWNGHLHEGYGIISIDGNKKFKVHRLSYLIHNGDIPPGAFVQHTCKNRLCVAPDHLYIANLKRK